VAIDATRSRGRARVVLLIAVPLLLLLAAAGVGVVELSGVELGTDGMALASLKVGTLGGTVTDVRAVTAAGHTVTLERDGDQLTPAKQLPMGESVRVEATVKRPGWLGWVVGGEKHQTLTVTTPEADVSSRWIEAARGGRVRVGFTGAVARVSYIVGHQTRERKLPASARAVDIGTQPTAGSVKISAAARPWERLGRPATVDWFPHAAGTVAIVSPKPGISRASAQPIRLTFSRPVTEAVGHGHPTLDPATPGKWTRPDSHTLLFTPAGYGTGFGQPLHVRLAKDVQVPSGDGGGLQRTREISYTSQPGSTLRLQQLLAEQGYLPVDWRPDGSPVAKTPAAQAAAATAAPKGEFSWRWDSTPKELKAQWKPSTVDVITKGAIMMFQDEHHLAVDGVAGPAVWKAVLDDAVAGKRRDDGYSYVYVHRDLPQRLVLWHDGHTVLTSPGNTGIPQAPTELGTFPVFEHLPVTTMSGTNPDGSHYNDPGIKWVSYFNGGDALHTFNRASFGTPQSLGCVELPEKTAARVYPYTPIGALVTIEH
jgi:hypothetical protein